MQVSLTVGKIDAGVCVLLTEDLRLVSSTTRMDVVDHSGQLLMHYSR